MVRRLINIGGLVLLAMFIVTTLAFTSLRYKNNVCHKIEINYENDDVIKVNKDELVRLVTGADKNIIGKKFEQINAEQIEKAVEKHDAVLKADVYKVVTTTDSSTYKGVLAVKVKHREPVVRIIAGAESHYLDRFGGKIPVSIDYAANVLVASGAIDDEFANEQLLPCVLYIQNDDFWKAQIQQIYVEKSGDVILTPLVGDHFIELGKLDSYQEKFQNMKAFYKQVLANNNWNKYESISLKFKNQVIAKRK